MSRLYTAACFLLISALWMIVRPYRGVRHDGVLYLGQTLGRMLPDSIGRDLFLTYGSQDRYSIFSLVMAPLVHSFGVSLSQIAILFLCEATFIFACWQLTAGLTSRLLRWYSMLSLVSLAHTYGGHGAFGFAEPFLSARSMSEPAVVLALAVLLRGRIAVSVVLIVLAAAIHPLIALPGLATIWVYLVLRDRRWLWALLVIGIALVAGALGMTPFDALWHRFDPEWWSAVQKANTNAFVANESVLDWAPTIFDVGILFLAARSLANTPLAKLIVAMLFCALAFTVLWEIGADLTHNILLTQLQLWRVFWLTHLVAVILLPVVISSIWSRGLMGRWAGVAVAFAAVAVTANLSTGWLCVLWAGVPLLILRGGVQVSTRVVQLAMAASLLGILFVTAIVCRTTLAVVSTFTDRFNGASGVQVVLGLTACCAFVGFILLRGLHSSSKWRPLSLVAVLTLAVGALSCWDQRSDWQHFVENGFQEANLPFAGMVPPSATVYWADSLLEPWMLLHHPQYLTQEQGAGLLFNRQTAVEFTRRRAVMAPVEVQKQLCQTVASFTGADLADPDTCAPRVEEIMTFCRTPGHPDFLVFRVGPGSGADGATAVWNFTPSDASIGRGYRLYDCARLG